MSNTFGPPISLDGPPPKRYPFGLLSVADEVTEGRWGMGAQIEPYPPETAQGHDPCSDGSTRIKDAGSVISRPVFAAFDGYVPITCTRRGIDSVDEFKRKANLVLEITDQWALERQLIAAAYTANDTAMDDATVSYIGEAGATEGLSLLEDAIADTGRMGVIHATPGLVNAWGADRLSKEGGMLRTYNGTPVIAGQGYYMGEGYSVTGGAATTVKKQYAFATGPVMYARGPVPDYGGDPVFLDRSDNTFTYRAERNLFVAWDKVLQKAVLVDRSA